MANHVDRIYKFKTPILKVQAKDVPPEQLEEWQKRAKLELQKVVQEQYAGPIDDLLTYLRIHL